MRHAAKKESSRAFGVGARCAVRTRPVGRVRGPPPVVHVIRLGTNIVTAAATTTGIWSSEDQEGAFGSHATHSNVTLAGKSKTCGDGKCPCRNLHVGVRGCRSNRCVDRGRGDRSTCNCIALRRDALRACGWNTANNPSPGPINATGEIEDTGPRLAV